MNGANDYLRQQGELFSKTPEFIEGMLDEFPDLLSNRERIIRAVLYEDAACLLVDYPHISPNHYWTTLSGYFKTLLDDQFMMQFLYQASEAVTFPFCLEDSVYEITPKRMEYYISSYYGKKYIHTDKRRASFQGRVQKRLTSAPYADLPADQTAEFLRFTEAFFDTASFLTEPEEDQAITGLLESLRLNPSYFVARSSTLSITVGKRILTL